MEPSYSYSDLKSMFYEWFYISFPDKFPELTYFEREAICESNFKRLLEAQSLELSMSKFPELRKKS